MDPGLRRDDGIVVILVNLEPVHFVTYAKLRLTSIF